MPKRKAPPPTPKEQFKRFLETAKEAEVDEKKADGAFRKLTPRKPKPSGKR